jgi:importin subunit beta-1
MNNDTGAGTLAYEYWCSIGEIEITRIQIKKLNYPCKNYCNKYYKDLLEIIFVHLQLITGKSEESWSITKSASCLLSILSQCCEYNLIQEVVNYIGKNLQQNNYLLKESAILAFGAILETSHRQNMSVLVVNSIETLVGFLCEQTEVVSLKETAAWVIQKIAQNYTLDLSKNIDLFDKLIFTLISLLKTNSRKVVCYLTDSFHYFATSLKPNEGQNSNILSKHMKNLLNILLELAFTPNSYNSDDNVAQSCFFTMASIIENSCPDTRQIVHSFFNDLVAGFKSSLKPEFFPNQKMRFDYQAYIAATIEPCLVTGYVNINFDEAKEIMNIVITTFKERGCVYEEGLIAASSVGLSLKDDFDILVKEFGSYLIFALNQISDNSLCKTAIHSTSDLIRSIGSKFSQYLDQILPIILQILASTEADKNLKPHCFNVISDVFLTCKESIFPYFKDIMNLISSALEAATYIPDDKEDFENYDYFESLREHILECLICIFQTVVDIQKQNEFREFVPNIVSFIHKINSNNSSPTTVLSNLN